MHEVLHRMQKQAMINTIHQVYPMRLGGSLQATATMLGRKAGTMTDLFEKSIQTLELPRVLGLLADQAVTEEGKERCLALRPS